MRVFEPAIRHEIRMVGYDLLLYQWEAHEESGAAVSS